MQALDSRSEFIFDRKHQLFLNFIDHTDQAKNAVTYLEKFIFDVAVKNTWKSHVKYLDIGCGYGYKTQPIINAIKKYCFVDTTAIDPSSELLSIFKRQLESENINFACSTWENFNPIGNFDLITSIHTFYYIDNWEAAIKKMVSYLDEQGVICIAIRSNDEVCQFKDYFFKKIYGENKSERNFNELVDVVASNNFQYKTDIIQSKLNVADCLLENENGIQLIEFLLRIPYVDIANDIKDEIKQYLKKHQHDGYLMHEDGFIWISK